MNSSVLSLSLSLYLYNPSGLYSNQYMQNIMAAQVEGTTMRSEYISAEILENEFEFIIPLYKNMPTEKCERPATVTTVIEGEKVKINVNGEEKEIKIND